MEADREELRDEILGEAISLPAHNRKMFVERICSGDPDLLSEVIRFIDIHEQMASGFLESPPLVSEAQEPLASGETFDRYRIESVIGRGAMSVIYRAIDTTGDRPVALKLVNRTLLDDVDVRVRIPREMMNLRKLSHENIVRIFDSGDYKGQPFLVMELLTGEDLGQAIMADRCGSLATKLEIARQIAAALAHVHGAGILHRDIKPANVFLEQSGRAKLMDFGVSRCLEPGVTHASTFAGTLHYMAPEQISGGRATRATDIYGYGVLLYQMFTRRKGATPASFAALWDDEPATSVSQEALHKAGLPTAIIQLIEQSTSRDPALRPASFTTIQQALAAA